MFKEWKKFRGWVVLEYFMAHTSAKIHVKGLAKKLKISPGTSEIYLREYEKSGILKKEIAGNVHLYSLKNENALVKSLKSAWLISKIMSSGFIESLKDDSISIVLFGSSASGEYDEKSDVDIMVITDKKIPHEDAANLESSLGKEVGLTVMNIFEWKKKNENNDFFIKSILKNHIILYGEEI